MALSRGNANCLVFSGPSCIPNDLQSFPVFWEHLPRIAPISARRLQLRKDGKEYSLRVLVNPAILERLRSEDADLLVRMEKSFGVKLAFRADPAYHIEPFKIIDAATGEEYR